MKIARLAALLGVVTLSAACATERMVAPQRAAAPVGVVGKVSLLPLLYVVDGVRMSRDQVPNIAPSQVASVEVIKGSTALKRFGADASYGVVLITTRQASAAQ